MSPSRLAPCCPRPRIVHSTSAIHVSAAMLDLGDLRDSQGLHLHAEQRVAHYSPRYRLAFSPSNEDTAAGGAILGWGIHRMLVSLCLSLSVRACLPRRLTRVPRVGRILWLNSLLSLYSVEWSLSSSTSNDPVLHFVLIIPSESLHILNPDGTPSSNSFLLPQWGTIPSQRVARVRRAVRVRSRICIQVLLRPTASTPRRAPVTSKCCKIVNRNSSTHGLAARRSHAPSNSRKRGKSKG
jgi:hypothetical protein